MGLSISVTVDDDASPYEAGCALVAAAQQACRLVIGRHLEVDENQHLKVEAPKLREAVFYRVS